jgi:bifunctional non-homologous end joining protein LigD
MTPTDTTNFHTSLFFREGASDKIYNVELVRSGDFYTVQFAYGRRGSTLTTGSKTPTPVPLEKAKSIAEKLVMEKKSKGYTEDASGTRYAGTDNAVEVSPYLPQLLNEIGEEDVPGLLSDPRIACQEKKDGRRTLLVKAENFVKAVNRKGLYVGCPAHWGAGSMPSCVLDGEGVGDTLYAFDVIEINGRSYKDEPFGARYEALEELLSAHRPAGIELVAATTRSEEKRAWLERFRREQREGIVFKSVDAPYTVGQPASGGPQRKFKFTESSTFVVSAVSSTKRSVAVAAFDVDGMAVGLGNVTIPPNHAVPAVGSLVEVRYLYRFAAGSLFQPAYLGIRDDLETSAATLSQIRRIKKNAPEADEG